MQPLPLFLLSVLAVASTPATSQEVLPARIAVLSPNAWLLYGQEGYCGAMETYDRDNKQGVLVTANRRVWFRAKTTTHVGDFSFVPEAGRRYVVRVSTRLAELYELVPSMPPVLRPLTTEEKRLCLLPWNHIASEPAGSGKQ